MKVARCAITMTTVTPQASSTITFNVPSKIITKTKGSVHQWHAESTIKYGGSFHCDLRVKRVKKQQLKSLLRDGNVKQ